MISERNAIMAPRDQKAAEDEGLVAYIYLIDSEGRQIPGSELRETLEHGHGLQQKEHFIANTFVQAMRVYARADSGGGCVPEIWAYDRHPHLVMTHRKAFPATTGSVSFPAPRAGSHHRMAEMLNRAPAGMPPKSR